MVSEASSDSVGVEYIPLDHSGGRFVDPFQAYAGTELAPVVPLNTITGIDQLEAVMVRHGEPVEIEPVRRVYEPIEAVPDNAGIEALARQRAEEWMVKQIAQSEFEAEVLTLLEGG